MKKYTLTALMALCLLTAAYAQDNGDKATKKDAKMEKKATEMHHATRRNNARRSAKKMSKMEKKEDKMNKKEDKLK